MCIYCSLKPRQKQAQWKGSCEEALSKKPGENYTKTWTENQWQQVSWSDECKFEIFGLSVNMYRAGQERGTAVLLHPSIKHDGVSVMVCQR